MKLQAVPQVEVTLCVNGEVLQEFDDVNDERIRAIAGVGYVEARDGANFVIRVSADKLKFLGPHQQDGLQCTMYLDGKLVSRRIMEFGRWTAQTKQQHDFLGVNESISGGTVMKRFRFASLETSKITHRHNVIPVD